MAAWPRHRAPVLAPPPRSLGRRGGLRGSLLGRCWVPPCARVTAAAPSAWHMLTVKANLRPFLDTRVHC